MSSLTPADIAEINEFGEAEAHANYFLCAPPEFARPFRLEVKRFGSVVATMIPEYDHPLFNRILGLGVGEPAAESVLDEAIAFLENAGCKNYIAQVSPLAQPVQLPDWLAARGLQPGRNWAKMVRGNEPPPDISTALRVEKIGKDQADAFADVTIPVWGMPPAGRPLLKGNVGQPGWHHYLAFDGEKPVSVAAMFVHGEIGWLGFASTLKKTASAAGRVPCLPAGSTMDWRLAVNGSLLKLVRTRPKIPTLPITTCSAVDSNWLTCGEIMFISHRWVLGDKCAVQPSLPPIVGYLNGSTLPARKKHVDKTRGGRYQPAVPRVQLFWFRISLLLTGKVPER